MIGNSVFLDTNIVIEIFEGNKLFADKLYEIPKLYISSIVLGELYVGVNRVANKAKHLKKLNKFLKLCIIVDADRILRCIMEKLLHIYTKKENQYQQMIFGSLH